MIVVMFVPFAGCPSIAAIAERGYVPNVGGANLAELVSVETCIRICRNVAATHATLFEVLREGGVRGGGRRGGGWGAGGWARDESDDSFLLASRS